MVAGRLARRACVGTRTRDDAVGAAPMPDLGVAFFAVVPAFMGTWLGVGLRRAYVGTHEEKHPRA